MKRFQLIWGAFLTFLLFACSYELEGPPPLDEFGLALKNFGVSDARHYFEENATDLSYVRLGEHQASTRSVEEEYPELSPDWRNAVRTENKEAVLVEVPIRSAEVMLSVVRHFKDGKFCLSQFSESHVRLVVARRRNGQTQMFVVTLVPSAKYLCKDQDMENFRYLGGGNFTGKVFSSTLDGHFVEASQYVNGRFIGMLNVTTRERLAERGESLEGLSYEAVMLSRGIKTRSGSYSFSEGNPGITTPRCTYHPQYEAGNCPACLSEVLVIVCQRCGKRLEEGEKCYCSCSRCGRYPCRCCPYCNNYPCSCSSTCNICRPYPCTRCAKCGLHYCFGSCEETEEGEEGEEPGGRLPDDNTGHTTRILPDVDLTNKEYFVGYGVSKDCMKGCNAIMANYGVFPGTSANVYQLLFERNGVLEYYDTQNYKTVYDNAIACINRHLDANRPIIVGVNHSSNKPINEGTTDHWIVIAGRGYDTTEKQYYYTYMDTGRSNASDGCNTTENRLYYDSKNYIFRDNEAGWEKDKIFDVSQIRPNDGKRLEETISQPARNSN